MGNDEQKAKELFFKYVWNHTDDVFYVSFDEPPARPTRVFDKVKQLLASLEKPDEELKQVLTSLMEHEGKPDVEFLSYVIQLAGYTRNKILVDLEAMGAKKPSKYESLIGTKNRFRPHESWEKAAAMLIFRLKHILLPLASPELEKRLQALDWATYPGYIRQQRAKHIGHYAEQRLAVLLSELGLPFAPKIKVSNPLAGDINYRGQSFDLAVPEEKKPFLLVKSTVHTSNTGQYGESKDKLEIKEAAAALKGTGAVLVALADGVGFRSNADALRGLFRYADEVVQFATLWKVPAIAVKRLGWGRLALVFHPKQKDQEKDFVDFIDKWEVGVDYHSEYEDAPGVELEGVAKLRIEKMPSNKQ